MEIQDLNKLTNMFLNKTASAQDSSTANSSKGLLNQGVSSSEFLAVLKQQSYGKAGVVETQDADTSSVSDSAPVERNHKNTVSEKNIRSTSKVQDSKAEAKDNNTSSSQEVKDSTDNQSDTRTENKDNSSADKDSSQDNTQSSSNEKTSTADKAPVQTDKSAETTQNAAEVPADSADNISAENSESSQAIDAVLEILAGLGIQVADIAELSAMPSVTVFNPATNKTTVMSGQDLLSMLTNAETPLIPVESSTPQADIVLQPFAEIVTELQNDGVDISSLTPVISKASHTMAELKPQLNDNQISDNADIVLQPFAEIVTELQNDGVDISSLTPVISKASHTMAEPKPQLNDNQFSDNADLLADDNDVSLQNIQSEEIAKVLPEDKKVAINVNVQEENFAYTSADDSVAAAVSAVVAESEASTGNAPQVSQQNVSSGVAPQAQAAMFANAQAQNNSTTADTGNSQIISGIKEVSTNQANLAQSGLEASHNVKNEQALQAENKNSSLRDVYKGMSKEVIDQIKVNITKSAVKGVDKIEIQLKPEDLGHIEIKMQISKDGKLQAHIISSRAETMDMLQKDMSSLEKAFNDAGFNTDEGSFSFSFRDNSHQDDNHQALRSFLGDALEQNADNENMYGDQTSVENWDGRSALNIRV